MGRFHRHPNGTVHNHDHLHNPDHDHREVGDHSGYEAVGERIAILEAILGDNDKVARRNRAEFEHHDVRVVNLMSSPGAGKTSLLRQTARHLEPGIRFGVLEGDIETSLDADRLEELGVKVALVNTSAGFGGECHLDAVMVRSALPRLALAELDLLVIENVGNLVCPAEFDVGAHANAMIYAITEGEEKPLKYPVMFRAADIVVVNKIDLLPHLDFDLDTFLGNLQDINPEAIVVQVSARRGDGVDQWCTWLEAVRGASLSPTAAVG